MKRFLNLLKLLFVYILSLSGANTYAQSGRPDPSFTIGSGANTLSANAVQPDGQILIGGYLTVYNGVQKIGIARLNTDGTLDNSFHSGSGPSGGVNSGGNGSVEVILPLPNGKILIAGNFTVYDGVPRSNIARLNADGSIDLTFDPGTGANDEIYSMEIQPNGKLLIVGKFTQYQGSPRNYLARLNVDGTLDTSYDPGSSVTGLASNNAIMNTATLSNGEVLVAGAFRSDVGNSSKNGLVKLLANGTVDPTFNTVGVGTNSTVFRILMQPDGKILLFGDFTNYDGIKRNRIVRLMPDGTVDPSFDPGIGVDGVGHYGVVLSTSAILQPDGKIIMVGDFSTYAGRPYRGIVRLNSDGSLDTTFDPGLGANDIIWEISLLADSRIFICGNFTSFDGVALNSLACLTNCYNTYSTQTISSCNAYVLNNKTYLQTGTYQQILPKSSGCDSIITLHLTIDTKPDSTILVSDDSIKANQTAVLYQWINCTGNAVVTGATNQTYMPSVSGSYKILLKKGACNAFSECVPVEVVNIYPNLVTGNGDGKNDFLELPKLAFPYTVEIFNRWGSLIFKSSNYQQSWPGSNIDSGLYYYIVYTSDETVYKSWLQVIR